MDRESYFACRDGGLSRGRSSGASVVRLLTMVLFCWHSIFLLCGVREADSGLAKSTTESTQLTLDRFLLTLLIFGLAEKSGPISNVGASVVVMISDIEGCSRTCMSV